MVALDICKYYKWEAVDNILINSYISMIFD